MLNLLNQIQAYTVWIPCVSGLLLLLIVAIDKRRPTTKPAMLSLGWILFFWGIHFALPLHSTTEAVAYAVAGVSSFREFRRALHELREAEKRELGELKPSTARDTTTKEDA